MKATPVARADKGRGPPHPAPAALELWGGAECTVNRIGDMFKDQLLRGGHHVRLSDFDLLAELDLAAYRLPVLWERIAPNGHGNGDWSWSDARIARLRAMDIRPILGLVHHGSGPAHTSLISEDFSTGLARHARAVAERYPDVLDWTPVNEPLTTARFSALYGHWYPHLRDERQFWSALFNQIDATRLAMAEIRAVIPAARLIQTEDMGRTYATEPLADQAAFDNVRRWMTFDLLCGRVAPGHDLWPRLCRFGFEDRLWAILAAPCPPDVIGINHYLTSDRFLDHRTNEYPPDVVGTNGRLDFADIAGVRALSPPPAGLRGVLLETWDRYGLPLAVTEVHNGCTRDEQLRWMDEAWSTANSLRGGGVDVRAVTTWAMFGSHDWDTLLTGDGSYEPGVFDTRGDKPRATALARLLQTRRSPELHPAIEPEGWWSRPIRLLHPEVQRPAPLREHLAAGNGRRAGLRPLLILGASGTLGKALAAACAHRNIAYRLVGRAEMDLTNVASMARGIDRIEPSAVINAAGWVRVDDAEQDSEACMAVNATGAIALARICARRGIATVNFSSDLVFPDCTGPGWLESHQPDPLNHYGRSKHRMEQALATLPGHHLIVRTAAFFSPFDDYNFAIRLVRDLADGRRVPAAGTHSVSPTYVPDLCDAVLDLVIDRESGLWHLSNGEGISWSAFAHRLAVACGLDPALIADVEPHELGWRAPRPTNSTLLSERGLILPDLDRAITRFARDIA